ncbi:MAG: RluA family pseudouridine synthase [Cyanobacteria bacterium P01_F01_bin.42]
MNQGWDYKNTVRPSDAGQTVLEFYCRFKHSSTETWRSRIAAGLVSLNGQRTTPETRLGAHQKLVYHRPPWSEPRVPLELPILYQDDELWVINKPAGLPVLPGGQFLEHTVLGQLRQQFPDRQLAPVHRLGRGTSGLLIVACTSGGRAALSQQLRDRLMVKRYRALIEPGSVLNHFTITQPIGRCPYPQLGYLYCASPSGKPAESICTVLKRDRHATLVAVQITTGRPHQIRIHLAYYGYPLQGDPLYVVGGKPDPLWIEPAAVPSDCGYHLHAHQLEFLHPRSQMPLLVQAPVPKPLQD